ncbi:MAG: hypothetical protein LBT50_08555 [Prevotellaceae bacterium]|jgi:hypothetical protein|nr:hypothetical protein [Prevotellaceae bacterium]
MKGKAKSREEIALEYNICSKTLTNKMKVMGFSFPKGLLYPAQQEIIYAALGRPEKTKKPEETKKNENE